MRINSYGKTAMAIATNRVAPVKSTTKTQFLSVMELQEMSRKDSNNIVDINRSALENKYNQIDFCKLLDAIIESGDLKS